MKHLNLVDQYVYDSKKYIQRLGQIMNDFEPLPCSETFYDDQVLNFTNHLDHIRPTIDQRLENEFKSRLNIEDPQKVMAEILYKNQQLQSIQPKQKFTSEMLQYKEQVID